MSIGLDQVTKRHGRTVAVDRMTLDVAEHEMLVLLGPSGSGKSTVLRIIAGLVEPDSGRVLLRGRDVTHLPPQGRGIGFVFQDYSLFRHMTVAENVEFGMLLRKVARRERMERRDELLDLVGLGGHANRFPSQLSGGQKQRVALARALAYRPDVLLLDEPFGALDARTRTQLRATLKEIHRTVGVTTVLVTHDQEEAFELADRIGVVDRGRLLELEEPEQLYRSPRTEFTATFVGGGTVLVAHPRDGQVHLGDLALPIPREPEHEGGRGVQVLIRPEQVVLGEDPSATGAGVMPLGTGTVVSETYSGSQWRVRVALPHLPGVRQIAPPVPFGERRLLVDATVATPVERGRTELPVGIRGFHVLEPPPPRLLTVDPRFGEGALDMADSLAKALDGAVTVLGIADDADHAGEVRTRLLENLDSRGVARREVHVRVGELVPQLLLEQHETLYTMVVVAPESREAPQRSGSDRRRLHRANRLGRAVDELLASPATPVLVVPAPRQPLRRVLVCTAVGEPGEHGVRLGGWLARRLGASVTLLHVLQGAAAPGARARAHLERGEATLRAMDVEASIKLRSAPAAVVGIIGEAEEGDHDLIVIGHHGPRQVSLLSRDNVTLQLLVATNRPVLVVTGTWTP